MKQFAHGWTFHAAPDAERVTFYAYGRKNAADLDRLVGAFQNSQAPG
jgi:hypothetical protein